MCRLDGPRKGIDLLVVGSAPARGGSRVSRTSIVIPTYRRPGLLRRAVRSALAQTHADLEVWVYDNASGDETEAVVAELAAAEPRLHYHRHERNLGSFGNFRYAIERVQTDFFSILADDDLLLPDFHRLALEPFAAAPELVLVGLDCIYSDTEGRLLRHDQIGPGTYRPPEGLVAMLRHGHLNWTSVLFRRGVLEVIGGLDPAADLYLDFDVLVRAAARAAFAVRSEPGAVYFTHEGSISFSGSADSDRWTAFAAIIERTAADPELPDDIRREAAALMTRRLRSMLLKSGVSSARRGNVVAAARASAELAGRLGDRRAALAMPLVNFATRIPGVRSLLGLLARSQRPYTGQRLADRLRGLPALAQIGGLTDEQIAAFVAWPDSGFGQADTRR
jgi:GT2 family glycosyltransferase